MANLYTPNIGLVKPSISDFNWADEFYRNTDISDILLSSFLSQNRLLSGGKVTTVDNINALYEAGSVWVDGFLFSWISGSLIPAFGPSGLDFFLNWLYVNFAGVVTISPEKPTGQFVLLAILDVDNSQILRIFDVRRLKDSVPLDIVERGNRNYLDNVGPDIWQRGTSQTATGYLSDDRWLNGHVGVSKTHLRNGFNNGQLDVPGNPRYYSRTNVTNVVGSGNYCIKQQIIEGVHNLAGKKATLSFWGKADTPKNIAIEFQQHFGSGGTVPILGIQSQLIALSSVWQKYIIIVEIPSISGKIIGSDGLDALAFLFWFNAGSIFAGRAANLGQQSGTFDLCKFRLEEGEKFTEETPRTIQEEIERCKRFFQTGLTVFSGNVTSGLGNYAKLEFTPEMRKAPAIVGINAAVNGFPTLAGTFSSDKKHLYELRIANATTSGYFFSTITADAE